LTVIYPVGGRLGYSCPTPRMVSSWAEEGTEVGRVISSQHMRCSHPVGGKHVFDTFLDVD